MILFKFFFYNTLYSAEEFSYWSNFYKTFEQITIKYYFINQTKTQEIVLKQNIKTKQDILFIMKTRYDVYNESCFSNKNKTRYLVLKQEIVFRQEIVLKNVLFLIIVRLYENNCL